MSSLMFVSAFTPARRPIVHLLRNRHIVRIALRHGSG